MLKNKLLVFISILSFGIVLVACGTDIEGCGEECDGDDDAPSAHSTDVAARQSELPTTKCTTYYYDAPNGNIVGMCTIACSGGPRCTGITTAYHESECESCLPQHEALALTTRN